MTIIEKFRELTKSKKTIVLPEGKEERSYQSRFILSRQKLVHRFNRKPGKN
jgi:hypothetical protein